MTKFVSLKKTLIVLKVIPSEIVPINNGTSAKGSSRSADRLLSLEI